MSIDGIQAIQSRISQIETMVSCRAPQHMSCPQPSISSAPLNFQDIMKYKTGGPSEANSLQNTAPSASSAASMVKPLAQNNGISCGQTSVAMCVNALTGKSLIDSDINSKYGFGLLEALNAESRSANVVWKDGGVINKNCWALLEQKVNNEGIPAVVGLNGPEFSPSGRGHIVTITKIEGNVVHVADPATGTMRTTTKEAMNNAPSHPDGNFIFYGTKQGELPPMMASNNFNPYMMLGQMGHKGF